MMLRFDERSSDSYIGRDDFQGKSKALFHGKLKNSFRLKFTI